MTSTLLGSESKWGRWWAEATRLDVERGHTFDAAGCAEWLWFGNGAVAIDVDREIPDPVSRARWLDVVCQHAQREYDRAVREAAHDARGDELERRYLTNVAP